VEKKERELGNFWSSTDQRKMTHFYFLSKDNREHGREKKETRQFDLENVDGALESTFYLNSDSKQQQQPTKQ